MTRKTKTVLAVLAAVLAAWLVVPYTLANDKERDDRERMERRERTERRERMPQPPRAPRGRGGQMQFGPGGPAMGMRGGGGMPGMMGGYARQVGPHERMEQMMRLVERMRDVCFEPPSAAMIAIGALKDEVRRKPEDVIADLEEQLKQTQTLGLRNAIRLSLKELYKAQDQKEKVLEHMRAMLRENDKAIQDEIQRDRAAKKG